MKFSVDTADTKYDNDEIECGDMPDLTVTAKVKLDLNKFTARTKFRNKFYYSKLRTVARIPHCRNGRELLLGLIKRNMDAPLNIVSNRREKLINKTLKKFLNTFCRKNLDVELMTYIENPVSIVQTALTLFMETKDPNYIRSIANNPVDITELDPARYNLMPRVDLKTKVEDIDHYDKIQTVVYQERQFNAIFGSIFNVIKKRLKSILLPNVAYTDGMSFPEVQDFIRRHEDSRKSYYLENDFSSYDKTQTDTTFQIEYALWRTLGVDPGLLQYWIDGHIDTYVVSSTLGVRIMLQYQRKSGDVTTSLGNTVVNMMTVCAVYDVIMFKYAVFSGDDSLIALTFAPSHRDVAPIFIKDFNLSAKMLVFTTHGYFLSHFIFKNHDQSYFIYDPYKMLIKIGRPLVNLDVLPELFTSYGDTVKAYDNVSTNEHLMLVANERYARNLNLQLPSYIFSLFSEYTHFSKLYL